jgi:hypothetical protein
MLKSNTVEMTEQVVETLGISRFDASGKCRRLEAFDQEDNFKIDLIDITVACLECLLLRIA